MPRPFCCSSSSAHQQPDFLRRLDTPIPHYLSKSPSPATPPESRVAAQPNQRAPPLLTTPLQLRIYPPRRPLPPSLPVPFAPLTTGAAATQDPTTFAPLLLLDASLVSPTKLSTILPGDRRHRLCSPVTGAAVADRAQRSSAGATVFEFQIPPTTHERRRRSSPPPHRSPAATPVPASEACFTVISPLLAHPQHRRRYHSSRPRRRRVQPVAHHRVGASSLVEAASPPLQQPTPAPRPNRTICCLLCFAAGLITAEPRRSSDGQPLF